MKLRYDDYEKDAVLHITIQREDSDGEPISPPLLSLRDEASGEHFMLSREQAWKLRDLINTL